MAEFQPISTRARLAAQWALTLAIFAGMLFIVVLVMGVGGSVDLVTWFAPAAVIVTVAGLIAAVIATRDRRTRSMGITALFILVPCVVLSGLTILALLSR